jgi:hypothetical protein
MDTARRKAIAPLSALLLAAEGVKVERSRA